MVMRKRFFLILLIQTIPTLALAQSINEELIQAVRKSDVESVKTLLAKGADANARADYGRPALSFACDRGDLEIVKLLLSAGADINLKDYYYKVPPANWAVMKDHSEVVGFLVQKGAGGKDSLMASAVFLKKKNTVKSLLEFGGFSPEALGEYLAMAEDGGASEIAELLKNAGAKSKPKKEYKIEPEALKIYEGVFRNEAMECSFEAEEGKLICKMSGFDTTLLPVDKHTFESQGGLKSVVVFTLDGDRVVSVTFRLPAGQVILKKVGANQ